MARGTHAPPGEGASGETGSISLGGSDLSFSIRRSKRAKRARIRIVQDRVEVVLTMRASASRAREILKQNAAWVLRHIEKISKRRERAEKDPFPPRGCVLYRGEAWPVQTLPASDGNSAGTASEGSGSIRVFLPVPDGTGVTSILEGWLKSRAREEIWAKAALWSAKMGLAFRSVSVRDQRTRWGGCSKRGTLTFNWRLIMAPEQVLDYLVVHELAHLVEMNHSPKFWAVVAKFCPDFASCRRWLREHQSIMDIPAHLEPAAPPPPPPERRWVPARLPF